MDSGGRQPTTSSARRSATRQSVGVVSTPEDDIEKWSTLFMKTNIDEKVAEAAQVTNTNTLDELRKLIVEINETNWMYQTHNTASGKK